MSEDLHGIKGYTKIMKARIYNSESAIMRMFREILKFLVVHLEWSKTYTLNYCKQVIEEIQSNE